MHKFRACLVVALTHIRQLIRGCEKRGFYLWFVFLFILFNDWESNVPWWEKQFCLTVGSVPWKKVLIAKKYMHCHDSVVKWNDSANEEAFTNAKSRYRADMDGLPCDIPLPDPDIYIDEIDWNPDIDPKLIADLDKEYFNPDEGEKIKKVETVENISSSYNSGEGSRDHKETEAAQKDVAQGWNRWDDCIGQENNKRRNNATENPWEQNNIHTKGAAVNDTTWLSCSDKSWGWKQKGQVHEERPWSNNFKNQCSWQNVGSAKEAGWCSSSNNYKGQNQTNNDRYWGWRQQPGQSIDSQHLDSSRGGGQWRKREGSYQYSSRHKSPRFHRDDRIDDRYWRNGNNQNRVDFS